MAKEIKIAWRPPADSGPVLEIARLDLSLPAAERAAVRTAVELPAPAAAQAGRLAVTDLDGMVPQQTTDTIARTLGGQVRGLIETAWRPEYCCLIGTQADALRTVMALADEESIDGLRLDMRFTGAPPLVTALTIEVLARRLEYRHEAVGDSQPVSGLAYALDAVAALACFATRNLDACTTALRLAARWREDALTLQLVDRLRRWFLTVLSVRPELASFAETMELLSARGAILPGGHIAAPTGPRLSGVDLIVSLLFEYRSAPRGPIAFGTTGHRCQR